MTGTTHTQHVAEQRALANIRHASMEPVLGRYRLLNLCGTGGMSTVYRALDLRTSTIVAVKIISIIQDRERTKREVAAIRSIDHPSVVKMLDGGAHRDDYVLVMEFVEGHTLRELLDHNPGLTVRQAVCIAIEVLEGLAAVHRVGLVHRDVKPSNLMITDVQRPAIRILDFGVAKRLCTGRRITGAGTTVGTPTYMAPEQLLAMPVNASADVYSVGLVLWQMLTGVDPTHHGLSTLSGKIKLWRSLSFDAQCRDIGRVFEIVAQMLHPDPLQRLPTAVAGVKQLRMTLAGSDAVPRPRTYDQTDRLVAASSGAAALDY